jgi:excisionase family DNA binding protein
MFTVNQIATKLNVWASTVYNLVESGELPHHRFGRGRGTIRVSEEQLQEFLGRTVVDARPATTLRLRDIRHRDAAA